MSRVVAVLAVVLLAGVTAFAVSTAAQDKVPKCSRKLCQDVGCDPTFYCASGAHVVSCADICNGH
jgi:hypothetical protein